MLKTHAQLSAFLFYQWEALLKEVEKLAAMSKNYLKKRQFYKVNSHLQIWLISKACQSRNSCPLAMKASSTCSYAVTLSSQPGAPPLSVLPVLTGHLSSPPPHASSAFLDRPEYHSSVLIVCSSYSYLTITIKSPFRAVPCTLGTNKRALLYLVKFTFITVLWHFIMVEYVLSYLSSLLDGCQLCLNPTIDQWLSAILILLPVDMW